ncbi:tetratricopeptide repeat-containing diguanylate cyclase [Marinicella pacifica]|uniref:tetratricopeptide repeat-containing diguanylate cyclase n=1 Tax=Marinicella pacifica TaxID=1171543 RepID=UPI00166DE240|nr:diguanylate cyclase [Marinicella pacifica]
MNIFQRLWLTFVLCCLVIDLSLADKDYDQYLNECQSLEDDQARQALNLAEKKLSQLSKQQSPLIVSGFLGCAAWAAVNLNETELALNYASDLELMINDINDSEAKINLLRRVGGVFHQLGQRVAAVDNYQKAMELAESLNIQKAQIPILVNLGVLHSQIREEDQAIKIYRQALALMSEHNDFTYQAPVLFNLALTLNGQHRYNESLTVFHEIEKMLTPQWPDSRKAQVYGGLASVYISLKNHVKAQEYNQKALAILSEKEDKSILYYLSLTNRADILIANNQPQQALAIADEVWQYYQAQENREQLLGVNNPLYALSNVYESVNKPIKALAIRKLATEIDEDFQDTFNKEAMAQMQARLSDSQQRKQLAELKTQQIKDQIELNAIQHNRQLILLLVAFGSMLVFIYFYWQRQTNKRLHAISIRDSLTQLGNRRAIDEWLSARNMPNPPNQRLMWLIDLDLFKDVNDQYGHEAGDEVLKALAKTLTGFVNSERMVARWGGEEFMIISDDLTESEMEKFCDNLMKSIATTNIYYENQQISVTASIGVCEIKAQGDKAWHQALSAADKALYQAKDKGRNCMVCGDIKASY